nr:flavin reductase [Micromonospora sp. ANENR4]
MLNWPCENAKVELVADYKHDRRNLAVDLAALMRQATDDLTRLYSEPPDPAEMHTRFLGWLRSVRNV